MSNVPRTVYYHKSVSPCKDCEDRHSGCHSKCAKYGEWNEQRIQVKSQNYANVAKRKNYEDYVMNTIEELKKGRRRKR